MRHSPFLRQASTVGVVAVLLVASGALAADRPRPRPTPVPAPVATASPAAVSSPTPVEGTAPRPSFTPPPAARCYDLDRPTPVASPRADGSPLPSPSATPAVTPAPTPRPEDGGTTRVKVPAAGVRLDVPTDWVAFTEDDLAALGQVPELTAALSTLQASSLDLLAVDVLPGAGCAVGGDLSLYDLGAAVDPRLLSVTVQAIAAGLEDLPEVDGAVKVTTADLPIGEVQRLTFRYDATVDDAVTAWWVRVDVFPAAGRTLLAAYAAPEDAADASKPVFNAIAKSLREL